MELVFGYLAGLLTLINPCVLPVLPIVLASALQASRLGPVALAGGMSLSFVALGLGVSVFGAGLGIDDQVVSQAGAAIMVVFGVILLVPRFSAGFASATAGVSARADARIDAVDRSGLQGQFIGGMLLGAVWTPCVGPTLGGAIALASQGEGLAWSGAIMSSFALGISSIMLALGYGARSTLQRRQAWMRRIAQTSRPVLGAVFVAVGLAILFGLHKLAEIWALDNLPFWLQDLSVRF